MFPGVGYMEASAPAGNPVEHDEVVPVSVQDSGEGAFIVFIADCLPGGW